MNVLVYTSWFSYPSRFITQLFRDHSGYGLGQWEKLLHSNAFSHWPESLPRMIPAFPIHTLAAEVLNSRKTWRLVHKNSSMCLWRSTMVTHWSLDKMDDILKMVFPKELVWLKIMFWFEFKILFFSVQLTTSQHVGISLGDGLVPAGNKPLIEPNIGQGL